MKGWDKELMLASALTATLAFNLVFFVQELALVVPKAFVPGVHVWLYHNNHHWEGDAPILPLLQGTGAIGTLVTGLIFAALLAGTAHRATGARLFLFWMTFQGLYQCLSQIALGTILPQNDVGMALGYLGLGSGAKWAIGLLALTAMIGVGLWLMRQAVTRIALPSETQSGLGRMGFVFRVVTLPALVSVLLLIPYREPRNIVEVLLIPVIVTVSGLIWIQASAWTGPRAENTTRETPNLLYPVAALAAVLVVFQFVLRPGIQFS